MRGAHDVPTANDRLKERFGDVLAYSLVGATVAHFLVFQMWPEMSVPDWRKPTADELTVLDMPTVDVPEPPRPMARPVPPMIGADVEPTATIPQLDWEGARELPPPPPPPRETGVGERVPFVVYDVVPRLTNPDDFRRALERVYPASLRDAGIGGRVRLQVYVDASGQALDARIGEGSGYEAFDRAALSLVSAMRFSPAMNRDRPVAVWIELPIDFRTRE